tara:strand:+ start:464 stop:841 length:378 start_codon:yes stop_codon:yes gene_type:complete
MKLEEMTLFDLKNLTKTLRKEYKVLTKYKFYNLCKFDLICILRNSKDIFLDETIPSKLYVESWIPNIDGEFFDFEYIPLQPFKRSYYKGGHATYGGRLGQKGSRSNKEKAQEFSITHGSFTLSFE